MRRLTIALSAFLLMMSTLIAMVAPSEASAFYGWRVSGVPSWDTLNIRAYPSSGSRILVAYPNGTNLSMTGTCTGGVNLGAIAGWPTWKQAEAVRYVWCQVWVKPPGKPFQVGWVYGKYIRPL